MKVFNHPVNDIFHLIKKLHYAIPTGAALLEQQYCKMTKHELSANNKVCVSKLIDFVFIVL